MYNDINDLIQLIEATVLYLSKCLYFIYLNNT